MKWQLVWFYLSLAVAGHCASEETTEFNYEIETNAEEDQFFEASFAESYDESDYEEGSSEEEDLYEYDELFTTPFYDEMVTTRENMAADFGNPAIPDVVNTPSYTPEDYWYEEMIPKLKIFYTPYTALLYQEDEFGLEFLCPGYWLKEDVLLVRMGCWLYNFRLDIDQLVSGVVVEHDLNIAVLRLAPGSNDSGEAIPHLANIQNTMPSSLDDCVLYMLEEDYALFEMYSWAKRPLAFRRAQGQCPIDRICLRTRPSSSMYGVDFALMCNHTLVAMLIEDRSTYEHVFGRLTLKNLTAVESWISRALRKLEDDDKKRPHGTM